MAVHRAAATLEQIRQLLDMYNMGDQQQTQLTRTYEIGLQRLADMERQRDELIEVIADLKDQLEWGRQMLEEFRNGKSDH